MALPSQYRQALEKANSAMAERMPIGLIELPRRDGANGF